MSVTRVLFCAATFLGSFLLFLIQPMAAKMLLPIFGGSPAVWTASMLFFQVVLLLGYAYAHYSSSRWSTQRPKQARWMHIGLMIVALSLWLLTGSPELVQKQAYRISQIGIPVVGVFLVLSLTIGAGYWMVSSGSSILQKWFSQSSDPSADHPYFLYAISNIGSLLGLFAYPFVIEPQFGLVQQFQIWRTGFVILILLYIGCLTLMQSKSASPSIAENPIEAEPSESMVSPISLKTKLTWMFWAAVPSSLLLGATSYISSNVAPIPLIWILPLSLYLVTFILAFSDRVHVSAAHIGRVLPLVLVPLAFTICVEATEPLPIIAGFHLLVFFATAWMCHRRLSENKPEARQLTEFYLWLSIGGAVGGSFNALIAPVLFSTYLEYPLVLGLASLIRPQTFEIKNPRQWAIGTGLIIVGAMIVVKLSGLPPSQLRSGIGIGIPLVAVFANVDRTAIFGLGLTAIFIFSNWMQIAAPGKVLFTSRSFFGVHRVLDNVNYYSLVHGNTTHGRQSKNPALAGKPLTYYYPTGPVGQIFSRSPFFRQTKEVGLVGLGVGSLAAYGLPGQNFTYFEIDPEVIHIARDSGLFTFLKNSKASLRYVLGDARITLYQEPDQKFDFLVLDAFSSDAIPTHLLTQEALEIYRRKLKPGGIIAFHISNRYLEIAPVLAMTAKKVGFYAYDQLDAPVGEEELEGKTQSNWMILVPDPSYRELLWKPIYWNEVDIPPGQRPWTDDYVNLLSAFKPPE